MSELGKTLKERREELGLSLSEASLSTKISARMIAAIEKGDFEVLPALPFAKGFVRSYASYLKLDPDKMVQLFVSELGEPEEPDVPVYEAEKEKSDNAVPVDMNQDSGGMMRFFIIGSVVVLILAIVGVKKLVDKYQKEADVPTASEVSVSPIQKAPEEESPSTPEAAPAEPAPASAPVVQAPPKEEAPQEPAKVEEPKTEAPKAEPPKVEAPPVEVVKVEEPKETPQEEKSKMKEILLEALDRVQITVSVDGNRSKVSLNAGEVHLLRTDESVALDISDGGAVNLVVNGRSKGVPGSLGQRKQIKIP